MEDAHQKKKKLCVKMLTNKLQKLGAGLLQKRESELQQLEEQVQKLLRTLQDREKEQKKKSKKTNEQW